MLAANKIYIVGIGYRPLDKRLSDLVIHSDIIFAFRRLLEVFKGYAEFPAVERKIRLITTGDEIVSLIRAEISAHKSPNFAILASGDPMFHGIGKRIVAEFGKDMVEIFPDVSCVQMAFARIHESWDDAVLLSLHGNSDSADRGRLEDVPELLKKYGKIALLTNKGNHPAEIAAFLDAAGIEKVMPVKMYVVQQLGYAGENVSSGSLADMAKMKFLEPNLVIITAGEKY